MNGLEQCIGLTLRLADTGAETDRAQHAAAVGQHASLRSARAGVEDFAGQASGRREALDRIAQTYTLRVACGREHDAERGALIPLRLDGIEPAFERSLAQ